MIRDRYFELYARILSEQLCNSESWENAVGRTNDILGRAEAAAQDYVDATREARDEIADEIERIRGED